MTDDHRMSDGEKFFLAVVAFLVIRGLLKASEASDQKRVREAYDRFRGEGDDTPQLTLWGSSSDDSL